jgi:transposase
MGWAGFHQELKNLWICESSLIDSDFEGWGMPRPYSDDLRRRAIEAVVGGASRHEAAERFEVGPNWLRRWHDRGSAAAMPGGGSISRLEKHAEWLLCLVARQPDLTLDEVVAAKAKRRIAGSRSAVSRFYIRHKITLKKVCAPRSRTELRWPSQASSGFDGKSHIERISRSSLPAD